MKVTVRKTDDNGFWLTVQWPLHRRKVPCSKVYPSKRAFREDLSNQLGEKEPVYEQSSVEMPS